MLESLVEGQVVPDGVLPGGLGVVEVWVVGHHPLVDGLDGQSLVGGLFDGEEDEEGVREGRLVGKVREVEVLVLNAALPLQRVFVKLM